MRYIGFKASRKVSRYESISRQREFYSKKRKNIYKNKDRIGCK